MKMPTDYEAAGDGATRNKWRWPLIVGSSLVVLAILAGLAYWVLHNFSLPEPYIPENDPAVPITNEEQASSTPEVTPVEQPVVQAEEDTLSPASTTPEALLGIKADLATFDLSGLSAPLAEIDLIVSGGE